MANDTNLLDIKSRVLKEVAKNTYDGTQEELRDGIAMKLIPGPQPQYRCCIYKEREIIRQRVRLAEGKPANLEDTGNILQVIYSACADCPISAYSVTDNCQNCLGKPCINSCKFGAIRAGEKRTKIDANKCKECGQCAKACPYNAIAHLVRPCKNSCPVDAISYDEFGVSKIDSSKCIRCGQCIHSCPFGAIDTIMSMTHVIKEINNPTKKVYIMVAPAAEGQFGEGIGMNAIRTAMKKLGFDDMVEVGLGGDMTAAYEAEEWAEAYANKEKKTTSCCPAFVNMIKKHYPTVTKNISTTISPMCAVSRMIKAKEPHAVTVFLGPCVAKKSEAYEHETEGNADYVITFSEITAMLAAKEVELVPEDETYQEASAFGKRFGNAGGVTEAVIQSFKEKNHDIQPKVYKASGALDCKKALLMMKLGRIPADFVEGMMCEGGCVNGPCSKENYMKAKKNRDALIDQADDREIWENIGNYAMDSFSMHHE